MITNSLRVQLYIWLLAPLSIVAALDAFVTYGTAKDIAGINQDQLLLGSARTIAEQVRVSDSVLEVTIPPAALELLDSGAQDHVYYRVTDSNGRLVAGDPTLSNPSAVALPEHWNAHDTIHHDNPVRTIAFTQPIFGSPGVNWVVIEVGQTLRAKDALTQQIWLHAVRQQLLIVVLVAVLLGFGMKRVLAPLIDLRNRILQRQPGRFESIDVKRLPTELLPLVQTINDYAARLELHVAAARPKDRSVPGLAGSSARAETSSMVDRTFSTHSGSMMPGSLTTPCSS